VEEIESISEDEAIANVDDNFGFRESVKERKEGVGDEKLCRVIDGAWWTDGHG
jgi:hypothetical protein